MVTCTRQGQRLAERTEIGRWAATHARGQPDRGRCDTVCVSWMLTTSHRLSRHGDAMSSTSRRRLGPSDHGARVVAGSSFGACGVIVPPRAQAIVTGTPARGPT